VIDPRSKFKVLYDDNGSFSDLSDNAADLTRDNFSLTMVATEDYLYIGLHKPFKAAYVELVTPNVNVNTFTAQIWDGSAWVSTSLTDESKGWTRSGFMYWDSSDMESTTVNSVAKYYMRLRPSANHSATVLRGINLIFADDSALKSEFFEIQNSNILPAGEVSHIGTHIATRNYILHDLRNHYLKRSTEVSNEGMLEKINQFDLLDIFEIREAAVFMSLSKIFFNLSDNQEDHWWAKYREYMDKFEQKMKFARLSIDDNDNGAAEVQEVQRQFNPVRWAR
jgi:hypothetical protein